jgi:hypothetical protein
MTKLLYAKKLAVDEDNRVLVWVGDKASTLVLQRDFPQGPL